MSFDVPAYRQIYDNEETYYFMYRLILLYSRFGTAEGIGVIARREAEVFPETDAGIHFL